MAVAPTDEKGDTKEKGKLADGEVEERLGKLIGAYNEQDLEAVLSFYADSAYVRFVTFVPHTSDGKESLVGLAQEFRNQVCRFEVTLTEKARVWKKDDRVWTLQPFELSYAPKNGDPVYWKGRHSAIWEKRTRKKAPREGQRQPSPILADRRKDEGEWVIIQERIVERDTRANPFERHVEGQRPGMTVVDTTVSPTSSSPQTPSPAANPPQPPTAPPGRQGGG
jgi:ketosteroid isomerase-like protein